jgi:antibiotic biosynthesis monooxygenase (ABM) superfamily enzyme
MIIRIWHGWTKPENADAYEHLLKTEIFPGIAAKGVKGYRSIELLRRPTGEEVEFVTMMRFDSFQAVKDFAGPDYETAYVPDKARKILSRFDPTSQHYETRETLRYD